jgi:hypothetical protein
MKHIKKYNESLDTPKVTISGNNAYSSPLSSSSLNISVIKKQWNYEDVEGEMSIKFQTNESGVIINTPDEVERIIEFLMEYKDHLF